MSLTLSSGPSDSDIGRNIQLFRQARGWSQAELATHMSTQGHPLQQQTVLKIEKGSRPIKIGEAAAFAALFGVSVDQLIEPDASSAEEARALQLIRGLEQEIYLLASEVVHKEVKLGEMLNMLAKVREKAKKPGELEGISVQQLLGAIRAKQEAGRG